MIDRVELDEWLVKVSELLETPDALPDNNAVHTLLDLARDCAHEVERVAAPLTTYLVGVAVGRGASLGGAAARVTELALAAPSAGDGRSDDSAV